MSSPRTIIQEDMPPKGSMGLVPPMERTVYVPYTMREAREVGTAASQGPEQDSEVNHMLQSMVSMRTSCLLWSVKGIGHRLLATVSGSEPGLSFQASHR